MTDLQTTPLTDTHIALGARMAAFAGYNMPISYSGIKEEHFAVRQRVGMFDVSHMGEFIVRGKNALALVQYLTSNDASKLAIGDAQYACLPNTTGGIVDDLLVYRLPEDYCSEGEQAFMLVVNASNIEKDWEWVTQHNAAYDCQLINISPRTGLLAVQGPKALETLQKLTDLPLHKIDYYSFRKGTVAGIDNVLVSATGYTGSGGFEVYVNNLDMVQLWTAIMEAGAEYDIQPCGLGARDTLRLEMGYCLYGNDIDDTTSPIEAGLGWITKTDKGDFISRDTFVAQRAQGVTRKLVGFELEDRRVPRHGYTIQDTNGNVIGHVTSGTQSPTLDKPIGMGYVQTAFAKIGTPIQIVMNNRPFTAKVVKMPFYSQK